MKEKMMKFMYGRYGNDELNQFLSKLVFVSLLLSLINRSHVGNMFYYIGIILVGFIYFRVFSKNYSKRYAERMAYLNYSNKVRVYLDKKRKLAEGKKIYSYFKCPSCKQKVRIPKGRGKVSIHCPKCGVDFIKRS